MHLPHGLPQPPRRPGPTPAHPTVGNPPGPRSRPGDDITATKAPGREVPAVIVGAGPVGVVAANMLGQRGVACLVLERHHDVYPLPRTVHFDDEVFRVLQSIGLADEVRAITEPALGLQLMDAGHRPFARFHRDPAGGRHGYPEANVFSQPVLEQVLRAGLARFPQVELRCGAEVVAVEAVEAVEAGPGHSQTTAQGGTAPPATARSGRQNRRSLPIAEGAPPATARSDRKNRRSLPVAEGALLATDHGAAAPVRVVVRDRASGQLEEVHTHAVLGCDGANSVVRRVVGTTMEDLGFSQSWLLVDALSARPLANWDGVHQVCDPGRAATYMRVGPDRYRWQFQLRPGDDPEEMSRTDMVHRLIAPWLGDTDPGQLTIVRQTVYTFKGLVAHEWRRGRVFLLGDAAHLAPPFLGQGMCAGVRDAANLTWKLALVLQGLADERLLDTYEAERRPHARRMVKMAIFVGEVMTGGKIRSAVVREVLGRAAGLPVVNEIMTRSPCPPIRPGTLVRPSPRLRWRRPRLSGQLSPQPMVTTAAGREVALDEVLGDGFAVLARGADWAAALDEDTRSFFARLGTRYVGVFPAGSPVPAVPGIEIVGDTHRVLDRWLTRGRADAVVLRPDRTVLAAGLPADAARWRRELASAGVLAVPG